MRMNTQNQNGKQLWTLHKLSLMLSVSLVMMALPAASAQSDNKTINDSNWQYIGAEFDSAGNPHGYTYKNFNSGMVMNSPLTPDEFNKLQEQTGIKITDVGLPAKAGYLDRHPLVYKMTYPVRKTWAGCVWLGVKSSPIHPFLALCGYAGSIATPFTVGFTSR